LQIPAKWDFKVSKPIRFFALLRMTLTKAAAPEVISSTAALISWWAIAAQHTRRKQKECPLFPATFYLP